MERLRKKYIPMTETAFYILMALREPLHGYGIILKVEDLTKGRMRIGAGTIYGTLSKMEKDKLIVVVGTEDRRKIYQHTASGKDLLEEEVGRLRTMLSEYEGSEEDGRV